MLHVPSHIDEPSKAAMTLNTQDIFVMDTLHMSCDTTSDKGNPPAQNHTFQSSNGWSTMNPNTCDLPTNSVNQEADYSCAAVNYPDAFPTGLYGPTSDAIYLTVLGNSSHQRLSVDTMVYFWSGS